ncbi:carbohydrate ABC transporter permease [Peterkaempfera bronchialis]|uniref:Sugar ABC transporter permease n=1 Tax=Peterkaempfera bronchialis TaxID=2126346 RepID=A0A345SSU6_9ACTN|nr:sugar ABC transporter permease [Peterkaempfera bronchialis]AXI76801.1 sugar ABC transporter permease [Peterkaempfera bronchialis]
MSTLPTAAEGRTTPGPGPGPRSGPPRRGAGRSQGFTAAVFLAPALLGFALFYVYPAVRGAYLSFTDYNPVSFLPAENVGLDNYSHLLHDPLFWKSLRVTAWYVLLNIGSQTVLALILAALMARLTRSVVLRAALLVPWLVPNVTVGLLWAWLLDANLGFANHLLTTLGAPAQGFLADPDQAMPVIAGINTWAYTGYTALLLYAGMMQIPTQIYEVAALDGIGEVRTFFKVTLPLLRPVLALVLVVSLIGSFQIFDTIAVTTKGGPVNATQAIYFYIYRQAFGYLHMGYASALAMTLVLILGVLTFIQLRLLRASRSDLA